MSRVTAPTRAQLNAALEAAERMKAGAVDPHHLAHCPLFLWNRHQGLERLLDQSDRYLRFGMDERELSAMRKTVDKLRSEAIERNEKLDVLPI